VLGQFEWLAQGDSEVWVGSIWRGGNRQPALIDLDRFNFVKRRKISRRESMHHFAAQCRDSRVS